ncbi:ankyrin repeat-containing domain protein [Hypoxylon sp. NC0597]|nr:ankyrin repeat-containing domain protein [Hypoxylon sp. NC0597]
MQSFTPFPRFPEELKDLIWGFAVRNGPSLHFFRLTTSGERLTLEAPRRSTRARPSWTEENPSYYVYYKALWDTCRASRKAVEKYRQDPMVVALPSTSATLHNVFWNRSKDVVCLQPPTHYIDDCPCLDAYSVLGSKYDISRHLKYVPQFKNHWGLDKPPVDLRWAIEYHPSWLQGDDNPFDREAFSWARSLLLAMERNSACEASLFIIDTRRKPRLDRHPSAPSRHPVFESTTHYYFEAKQINDELFEEANDAVYWFSDDLFESLHTDDVLAWAVTYVKLDTLKVAVALGLDIHYNSYELLRDACYRGRQEVVNFLLDHGAQIDVETYRGCSVARLSALYVAITSNREDIAMLLLARGANPYFSSSSDEGHANLQFSTAIHQAVPMDMLRLTEFIVRNGLLPVDQEDDEGKTALEVCCSHGGRVGLIKKLAELGANVDVANPDGMLTEAFSIRAYLTAEALIDIGVKPNNRNGLRQPPIHACITNADRISQDTVCRMLSKLVEAGADINGCAYLGRTPLGEAVGREKPPVVTSHLLSLGANANAKDSNGRTPVDIFMQNSEAITAQSGIEKLKLLVQAGARMDTPLRTTGATILEWAVYRRARFPPRDFLRAQDQRQCIREHLQKESELFKADLEALLTLATPENLKEGYLDELLEQAFLPWYYSRCRVLIKHGATLTPSKAFTMTLRTMDLFRDGLCPQEFYRFGIRIILGEIGLPVGDISTLYARASRLGDKFEAPIFRQYFARGLWNHLSEQGRMTLSDPIFRAEIERKPK